MFNRLPRLRLSIRAKALLLSPLLLSIPYVGYQYVREMEDFLRVGVEESVLATARALASALNDQAALFARADNAVKDDVVYAHPLPGAIEVDGYSGDWQGYRAEMRPLPVRPASRGGSGRYVAGKRGDYLYLLVRVDDDDIVYRTAQAGTAATSDHLLLSLRDARGAEKHYLLGTRSPGWVNVHEIDAAEPDATVRTEVRIRAAWQVFKEGYTVEIRLPLGLRGHALGLGAVDVDSTGERVAPRWRPALRTLILPSSAIEELIRRLGRLQGTRVWVIDRRHRVLARGGTLERDIPSKPVNPLYAWLLRPPSAEVFSEHPVVSRLQGPEIEAALAGTTRTRWRAATAGNNSWIVSGAYPVWSDEAIVGAVVVEETSLGIQTLTREALANLFNKTLLVTVAGALALALFASRIARRLGRLRDAADAAIDAHGRVVGTLAGTHGSDEIGDLSASFSAMMERLRQYNDYLQNLARRLSHELRTPLAIVRSSLEAMQIDPSPEATRLYGARAREGLTRLNAILTRMSEASRLEEALQSAEREVFDLDTVLAGTVAAYRAAWPDKTIHYACTNAPAPLDGVPDLVIQMLDKLVSNALELGTGAEPVRIALSAGADRVTLTVTNHGSRLPVAMQAKLFESMVSIRDRRDRATPHLGLGLYIARIIAEFHGAQIGARNLADGVEMKIVFPRREGGTAAPTCAGRGAGGPVSPETHGRRAAPESPVERRAELVILHHGEHGMTITLDQVTRTVDGQAHIHATSLTLEDGTLNILLGPTLAGKTTLMRLLAGLDPPSSGRLVLDGRDITGLAVRRRNVAMVYQQFINYPSFTVFDNIAAPLRRAGFGSAEIDRRVHETAELLHMEALLGRLPSALSGGQQQRTALARALVKDAELLLLDEPLVNLDYKLREELREELRAIFETRRTIVVYATTEPLEALMLGGNSFIIDAGAILQIGPTLEVYNTPESQRVAAIFSDPPINMIDGVLDNGNAVFGSGTRLALPGENGALPDGPCRFGVRASHLATRARESADIGIPGTVDFAEISGSETFVHVRHNDASWVVQEQGVREFGLGEEIHMYLNPAALFVFDTSGKLISAPHRPGAAHG